MASDPRSSGRLLEILTLLGCIVWLAILVLWQHGQISEHRGAVEAQQELIERQKQQLDHLRRLNGNFEEISDGQ